MAKFILLATIVISLCAFQSNLYPKKTDMTSYIADPHKVHIKMYWKDDSHHALARLTKLDSFVSRRGEKLLFAMNGGMFEPTGAPSGLYIENGIMKAPLNTQNGKGGNLYLGTKGVFYLTKKRKAIVSTKNVLPFAEIDYATQSGPMLLINGEIPNVFRQGSLNKKKRNGVGILPNGQVLFALSSEIVNFYDFALFFKKQGCKNALYLDGWNSTALIGGKVSEQQPVPYCVMIGVNN